MSHSTLFRGKMFGIRHEAASAAFGPAFRKARLTYLTRRQVVARMCRRGIIRMRLCVQMVAVLAICAAVLARPPGVAFAVPPVRVQVTDPPRVQPSMLPVSAIKAKVVPGTRAHGVPVPGLPMFRPSEIDHAIAAARRRALQGLESRTTPSSVRRAQSLPSDPAGSGTGINPWWRYQEENVPGGGHLMVNVGTGNLLLQDDDMSVPHKGIALAFRRTYNSQASASTMTTTFGTLVSLYGNGWTNTFDAHFVATAPGQRTIYDVDGARYDYAVPPGVTSFPSGTALTSVTPGQHATLVSDGVCGWLWTKKSGTTYYFYATNPANSCPSLGTLGGYAGRLYQIIGRNRNTYITFNYSWDNGDASATGKISAIAATTESGMTATLSFADFNGRRLLQQLTLPDGATSVSYGYDSLGNLTWVSRPPNNTAGTRPVQTFGYGTAGGDPILAWASSPRWQQLGDGGYLTFAFNGGNAASSTLTTIGHVGVMNPSIADGTTQPLQSGYTTGAFQFLTDYFTTGVSTPTFRDTAGHSTNWVVDGAGRPTQTQECTATTNQGQQCTGTLLITNEAWDANNNLVSETDPRGNRSDYAYDVDGNTVAAAAPSPAPGAFRPTRLFTYDAHDNVTAYCDPNATHSLGADWVTAPAAPAPGQAGLCPQTTVATQAQWTATTAEPFGELGAIVSPATATAPLGYQRNFYYDLGPQGGMDYGLPTRAIGAAITQSTDPTTPTRQPQQSFWYDSSGNLVCYGTGSGQWLLTYDALNRLTSAADPDDSSNGSGVCAKTGAQPGWNTTSRTTYFPDGSVASKQTASQAANGVSTTFTYDLDGNEKTETHRYGCLNVASCTSGVTTKWYDGADRLVEVQQPYDSSDIQAYPWSTRYIYDLSQGQATPYRGMGLPGYGNLVSTQELLSGTVFVPVGTYSISSGTWTDVRATSYDAIDRPISTYEAAFGDQPKLTNTYDGPSAAGLLSSVRLATNELKSLTYDDMGRETDVSYAYDGNVTPQIHEGYDASGHVTSRTTSALGTETIAYDATGAVTSVTEPASLGGGTISYAYYADGLRSRAGYADAVQSYPNALQYTYRADGKRDRLTLGNGSAFTWTYTAAGRVQTQTDPLTGVTVHPDAEYQYNLKDSGLRLYYPASVTYGPWTQGYDSYGRAGTTTLPVNLFSYTASQYDLDDGLAALTASGYVPSPPPAVGKFTPVGPIPLTQSTIRNEKNPGSVPPRNSNTFSPALAHEINGAWLRTSGPQRTAYVDANWMLDARSGMLLRDTITTDGVVEGSSYLYDASGRLVQDFEGAAETINYNSNGSNAHPAYTQYWCPVDSLTAQNPTMRCYTNGSRSKTYDAENRLRTETFDYLPYGANSSGTLTYVAISGGYASNGAYWEDSNNGRQPANIQAVDYGATSHPMRLSLYHPDIPTSETRAWLWDGGDRFIECALVNGQCKSPSLSMEGLGDYDLASGSVIRINDRGRTGGVTMSRSATVFSGWGEAPSTNPRFPFYAPCSTGDSNNVICLAQHDGKLTADGWTMDYETWQGVRTSDLTVGQWNTPDAYAGEVHDPMSQKPFMWNGDNPFTNRDPSGYLIVFDGDKDTQQWEAEQYNEAIDYLQQGTALGAANMLRSLREDRAFTVHITVSDSGTGEEKFDPNENRIYWDARQGLTGFGHTAQSAALGLVHESDHALRWNRDPLGFTHDVNTHDDAYDTLEERRVILGSESITAGALGEPMRFSHHQATCITASVSATVCL
jgi:YD repeat-containing protein